MTADEPGTLFGTFPVSLDLPPGRPQPGAPSAVTVVYDNTASVPNGVISSTDLASDWGDRLFMTGGGLLSSHQFTLFNAASSAGVLLTVNLAVDFYDDATATFIGGYAGGVNFGAGLPINNYSIITASGLDGLGIILPANVICIQTVTAKTGAANRLGVVSIDPVTVGTSPTTMYISSATIGGGVPGFYNIGVPGNPGYSVGIAQPPVPTQSRTWGEIKKLYR